MLADERPAHKPNPWEGAWETGMTKHITYGLVGAFALATVWLPANADTLEDIRNAERSGNTRLVQAQSEVDTLTEQTDELVADYRQLLDANEALRSYNNQVKGRIAAQQKVIADVEEDINGIALAKRQIGPLIEDMLVTLREFVEQDLPFRKERRLEGIRRLEALSEDPNVTDSERYRLVLERYKIESAYGQGLFAYEDSISVDGAVVPATVLQVGRTSLLAQGLSEDSASYWYDPDARKWVVLDSGFATGVDDAIQMAFERKQQDLVVVPLPAPKEAK